MIKKLIFSLMLVCGLSSAVTASSINPTPFAKEVSALRVEAMAQANDKAMTTSYSLVGGATPQKVSLSLKKGEEVVIYSTNWVKINGKNNFWVINDASVKSNSGKKNLTKDNSDAMGAVRYRILNGKGHKVKYNGQNLENGIHFPMGASMLISAKDEAKEITFQLMLEGGSDASAVVKIQKVSSAKVDAIEKKYPAEVKKYSSFGKGLLPLLIYKPNASSDQAAAQSVIKQLKNKDKVFASMKVANQMKDQGEKCAAYVTLLTKGVSIVSLEERLSWLKVSAVEDAIKRLKEVEGFDVAANEARLESFAPL